MAAISKFGFSFGPTTLFAVLALIFILLYGLSLGRTRALISLLAIYVAYAIHTSFPYLDRLHELIKISPDLYVTRVVLFLLFYIVTFFILNRSLVKHRLNLNEASFFSVALISVLQLALLITIIMNIVPVTVFKISNDWTQFFATNEALFYWFLAPIVIVSFLKREKK